MDSSLAAFLDKGLEFVVGGTLFLASAVFLLVALEWDPVLSLADSAVLSAVSGGPLVVLMVVAAYAAGVIVESWCRYIFEWDLKRITVRHAAFVEGRVWASHPAPRSILERVLGRRTATDYYSAEDCKAAEEQREFQRSRVMTMHAGFYADVESQLKRLRLERIAAFCMLVVTMAFVARHEIAPTIVSALLFLALYRLVHGRFRRFCNSIARSFRLVEGGERQISASVEASPAE